MIDNEDLRNYLTVKEASQRLGVSPRRVRVFIDEGRLRALRVCGTMYLVDPVSLKEFRRIPRSSGRPRYRPQRVPE